jgi:glucose uptake protein GlcU
MHHWGTSSVIALLALLALIIGVVLSLSVVTKRDCEVEADRANTTRATLFLLIALVVAVFVLASQRFELADSVSKLLQ